MLVTSTTGRVDQSGFKRWRHSAGKPPGEQNLTDLDLLEEIEKEELLSIDREMTMEGLLSIPPGDYPGERTQMQKDLIEEKNYFSFSNAAPTNGVEANFRSRS